MRKRAQEDAMEQSTLTELYCPFPEAVSPYAEDVQESTVEWACSFELVKGMPAIRQIETSKLGFLAGRFHPEARREELQLVSDWYLWMFLRDDQCDESALGSDPELLASKDSRFMEILEGAKPRSGDDPLGRALHDLRRRVISKAPSDLWIRRFTRSIGAHFDSTLWEVTNRAKGSTPDLATYIRTRPITGGMHVDMNLIEMTKKIVVPSDVLGHPDVQRLTRASNNVVCWANDLFSLEKELERGDVHNLVVVLRHAHELTLSEAIECAVEMHDAEVHAFLKGEVRLPSFGTAIDATLKRYVSSLRTRMRGNLDWSIESGRYARMTLEPIAAIASKN